MKKTLSLLFLLFACTFFGQQKGEIILDWTDKTDLSFATFKVTVPTFAGENFQYDDESKQIFFNLKLSQSTFVADNALEITNVTYESIAQSLLSGLNTSAIPSAINAKITAITARDKFFSLITLSPIIKDGNGFKRIKSFTYNINTSQRRTTASTNNVSAVSNSVLASGDWFRFYVEKSGVYKISKGFLQSLGMNVSVDPKKIKIYGNGGRMLPLLNSTYYPFDLEENAIQFIGEEDGVFDGQDYILFYAEGLDNWSIENQTHNNLYASRSYYYVTANGDSGKRIVNMPNLDGNSGSITPISTFDDYQYHERDLINIERLGRRWFGEAFNINDQQEFKFSFPDIVTTEPIRINVYAASNASAATSLKVDANGQQIGAMNFSAISTGSSVRVQARSIAVTFPATAETTIKLTYENNGVPGSNAYLDYIILQAKRSLRASNKQFRFQYNDAGSQTGIGDFQMSNASGISQIWDITDIYNPTKTENAAQSNYSFKSYLGEVRKFIAIAPTDYFTPLKESRSRVANQNIKGTIFNNTQGQFQDIDYIIVTPLSLKNQAEKLAAFHRNYSQLSVKVVDLESIYQEFGSGKQDISAIRNMVKYVYLNASSTDRRIKYLNLFGDASFDFKDRIPNNSNIVPIFHVVDGYTISQSSFSSDDFFGLMDPTEGNISGYASGIDIATGRMLVNDTQQADEMVMKVIDYHDMRSYGSWRNNMIMISDDSDQPSDASLQQRQNTLSDRITTELPFVNVTKIFMDSYTQETSAGGNRYPKARIDMFNAFEKGALVLNYLGHGGEDGLSQERIWEKSDGQSLFNQYKYPLFITITCEFSRFDNPYRPTAGEYTYWNPKGGAIAMLTTIRSISQNQGENFNDVLSSYLFNYGNGSGPQTSIAEALRIAKNFTSNSGANVVLYLGDPALMLAIPKPKIRLTKVNDQPITGTIDNFKSLSHIKLTGEVTDENNVVIPSYNGELSVNIFDKAVSRATLNNDGNAPAMDFNVLGETIFRGNASVSNGQFEFGFVVPRDIRIPVGNGRISFYAKRDQILLDKTGVDTSIKIGGINENAAVDNIGPTAKLYMNDQTFISGGITNESPIFIAYLEDENGINTASGIGHDIVAILDGDESNPYVLNDYYETELDDYTKGKLQFPLRNLEKGLHTITFKAWDVYNNPITAEIQFLVVGDESITLTNVLNYPNPFVSYTQFWFTHNRPFEPLEVQVQVITITGKVVWTKNQIVTTDGFLSREIIWDGKDDFGDRIGKGVYVYKLTVKSNVTNSQTEKYEKLVIL